MPHNFTESGATIALLLRHAMDRGFKEIEVTQAAQDAWLKLLRKGRGPFLGMLADCTPGYYNNEGQPQGDGAELMVGHPKGPMAFFKYLEKWRRSGKFKGLEFR